MLDFIADTFHALTMDAFKEQSRQVAVARAKGLTVDQFCKIIEAEIIKLGNAWKKHCADEVGKREAEIAKLRAALCAHQLEAGTQRLLADRYGAWLDGSMIGIEEQAKEIARLRAALVPIIRHADAPDTAPPAAYQCEHGQGDEGDN